MPIINRNYYGAGEQGRQDADEAVQRQAHNALSQVAVEQGQRVNALMRDPNATSDQYARAGRSDVANALTNQQQTVDAQKLQHVKQLYLAAQQGLTVPNSKAFIEQNFPELAQQAGAQWATADDAAVKQSLQEAVARLGPVIGQGPEIPKERPLINTVGPDGKPIRGEDKVGVPVYVPPRAASGVAGGGFGTDEGDLMAALAERGVSLPAGFRSKDQQLALLRSLRSRNQDATPEEIADKVASGQINFHSEGTGVKQFTSGKNGNTIRSLNVAVQHLDQLQQLANALDNGDVPMLNKIAIAYKKQTGNAAPTNFEAAKKVVADEVVKAIVGSGGGVADRQEAADTIKAASSPDQLAGVIETYQGLLSGQLNGLRSQYKAATGRDDFEQMLLPETRAKLERHAGQGATPAAERTATGPNGQKLVLRNGQWMPQ